MSTRNNKKILFVNLSKINNRFPLGLAYLIGAVKEKTDFDTYLFDLSDYSQKNSRFCFEQFKKESSKIKPYYIAFTLFQAEISDFIKYAKYVKSTNHICKIIVGGPHPTVLKEHLIKNIPNIDILVIGEGELVLTEILKAKTSADLMKIPNIIFRKKDNIIINEQKTDFNFDIDKIPSPSMSDFDIKRYSSSKAYFFRTKKTITQILSRGCEFNCKFCISKQIYGSMRIRDPKKAIEETENLIKNNPFIENIFFTDNFFALKNKKIQEFLILFHKKGFHRKLSFGIQTRLDQITPHTLSLLKKNNCNFIGIGIENFCLKILNKMGKYYTLKLFEEKNNMLNKSGLFVSYYFILNYPGMTFEDLEYNLKKIEEYKLKFITISTLSAIPETPVFKELVAKSELPPLNDPSLDWNSDFMRERFRKDFIGLTKRQKTRLDQFLIKQKKINARHYLLSLPLKQKIKLTYMKTGLNPFKMVKLIFSKLIFSK